jgi:hypothetical protein
MGKILVLEKMMKIVLAYVMAAAFSLLYANGVIGTVNEIEGIVKVSTEGSIKKSNVTKGQEIKEKDLVSTSKNASVVIKLKDDSTIILDESATVHFPSQKEVSQQEGKIYYKITSRDASNALKVKTPFAIIGIKGTTFIVSADANNSNVKLQEGLIGVASIKQEFELYRKKVQQEFENFMKKQQSAFEEYKNAQQPGFAQITKEFDLKAGNTVSFDGNKVHENAWTEADEAEFKRFEAMMR